MIKRQISYIIFTLMLPYRNLWEGRDLCERVYAPRGLILKAGPTAYGQTALSAYRPSVRPSIRPAPATRGGPSGRAPRRAGTGGPGDRKELCIKTLYVQDRLCQQPLSCVRNASRRARCWLLLTLVATHGALGQLDREGAVGSYSRTASRSPPPRRLPRS